MSEYKYMGHAEAIIENYLSECNINFSKRFTRLNLDKFVRDFEKIKPAINVTGETTYARTILNTNGVLIYLFNKDFIEDEKQKPGYSETLLYLTKKGKIQDEIIFSPLQGKLTVYNPEKINTNLFADTTILDINHSKSLIENLISSYSNH